MTHTNKLVNERSSYLLQHCHNPVNWFAYFYFQAKFSYFLGIHGAKKRFKKQKNTIFQYFYQVISNLLFCLLIYLLIILVGYSTCHWCHVMEHESFENEDIAKLLNDNFVSIKVDREERPDVDKLYMSFVQVCHGHFVDIIFNSMLFSQVITGSGGWPMSMCNNSLR